MVDLNIEYPHARFANGRAPSDIADFANLPLVTGLNEPQGRYILVTEAATARGAERVGRIVRVTEIAQDFADRFWYSDGNWYLKGVPVNEPVQAGDRVMLFNIPAWTHEPWITGEVTEVRSNGTYVRVDDGALGTRNRGTILYSDHWVRLERAPEPVVDDENDEPRQWDVSQVYTWIGHPFEDLPKGDDGHVRLLVTQSNRRGREVGMVQQVTRSAGTWLVNADGDYVRGAPLNPPLGEGDYMFLLDGPHAGQVHEVLLTRFGRIMHYRVDGETYNPVRWVQARPPKVAEVPLEESPDDTPEVRALKEQARANQQRWDDAVKGIVREALDREWASHVAEIAEDVDGFPEIIRDSLWRVTANVYVSTGRRAEQADIDRAMRWTNNISEIARPVGAVMWQETFHLPRREGEDTLPRERVAAHIGEKNSYSIDIGNFATTLTHTLKI